MPDQFEDGYNTATALSPEVSSYEASEMGTAEPNGRYPGESSLNRENSVVNSAVSDQISPDSYKNPPVLPPQIPRGVRKVERERRAEFERGILNLLTEEQQRVVEEALNIVRETESTWLAMLFERVASVRNKQLWEALGEPVRHFEPVTSASPYFRERWFDSEAQKQREEHVSQRRMPKFIWRLLGYLGK